MHKPASFKAKVWEDTWQSLLNTKWGFIVVALVFGMAGGIFIVDQIWERALAGLAGAVFGVIIVITLMYLIHFFWITPKRQRKETKGEFIKEHAGYTKKLFGDSKNKKYLALLDTLQKLVNIENSVADSMFGGHLLRPKELAQIQREFKQNITLSLPHTTSFHSIEEFSKMVNRVIKKSGLQITGLDLPSDNILEFLIKTRVVLDKCGLGISRGLVNHQQYEELLITFGKQKDAIGDNNVPNGFIGG